MAVVAAIHQEKPNQATIVFSDGQYCLSSHINESSDLHTTAGQVTRLIANGKLYAGLKVRFVNQSIQMVNTKSSESTEQLTDHYFLQ